MALVTSVVTLLFIIAQCTEFLPLRKVDFDNFLWSFLCSSGTHHLSSVGNCLGFSYAWNDFSFVNFFSLLCSCLHGCNWVNFLIFLVCVLSSLLPWFPQNNRIHLIRFRQFSRLVHSFEQSVTHFQRKRQNLDMWLLFVKSDTPYSFISLSRGH